MLFSRPLRANIPAFRMVVSLVFFAPNLFAQGGKVDSTGMLTLRIDPQSARGARVSQVFSEVAFIPLETTKESLFGNISSLKIVKDHFVIYDYDTKAVLIFNQAGKFKGKIDASKIPIEEGTNHKAEVYGYNIVEEQNNSFIVIYLNKYVFYFDLNGKQVKKVLDKNANIQQNYTFGDKETVVRPFFLQKHGIDSTYFEFATLRKGKDTVGYFPFSMDRYQKDEFWGGTYFGDYGVDNEMFFINFYSYNIYKITPTKLRLAYRLIFPQSNSLPADFSTNPVYLKKRGEYFRKNPKVFYGISKAFLAGNNLFLKFYSYSAERDPKTALIYNLKSNELISLEDLEPDSLSSFLPVNDAGSFFDFTNHGFHAYKDGSLYTSYSSLAMFAFKEQLGDRYKQVNPTMQEYFTTQNRKSNPVIIRLKPRTD